MRNVDADKRCPGENEILKPTTQATVGRRVQDDYSFFVLKCVLIAVVLMIGFTGCKKACHKRVADDNGNTWLIDEMVVTITDNGQTIADTTVLNSGSFVLSKTKNKDTNGSGTVNRYEFNGTNFGSILVEEGFIWEIDEDAKTMIIDYQDGRQETFSLDVCDKKKQEWSSTSLETGDDVIRTYKLTLD